MERISNPLINLGKLKDSLFELFSGNSLLQALLMPGTSGTALSPADFKAHCFDVPFPPAEITDDRAFICLETEVAYVKESVLQIQLLINIYTCGAMIHMNEEEKQAFAANHGLAGNRSDMVAMAVHQTLTDNDAMLRKFGIGKMRLAEDELPVSYLWQDKRFYGRSLRYTIYQMPVKPKRQVG